ncbi:retinoblastoma-associated protein-like [Asterias rubens]|uniref:retinoblastoma-associated protein-like n=1 Tax=Asterias rubens TaxID=7604 RepID=UPI001454F905|nr:retinoblastoma-associated protein-like [Asterias rubens]XP_033637711.1 retinoblastoma-associated protein-like [Asterias rubens]XP_033637712.1 retinoblastoma-associated protein-like [Asterias rubens]
MECGDALSKITRTLDIEGSNISQAARRLGQKWECQRSTGSFSTDSTSFALCALFVASTMQRSSEDGSDTSGTMTPTLSDLLEAADVHIKRFFDWMGRLQADFTFDPVVKPRLKAIMQKYCVTSALYHKFQQLFDRIFICEHYSPPLALQRSEVDQGQPNRKHICWMLFLLAKGSLRQAANELVMPLHLLMGCIDYIAKLSPAFFLQEPFNSAHYSQDTDDAILEALCAEMSCLGDITDVTSVRESCLTPIIRAIPREMLNQGLEGLPQLEYLQQQYEQVYRTAGDIDEQLFLDQSSHLFVQKIPANEPPSSPDSSHERDQSAVPMTPVKKAISSVKSLKFLLSEASDSPSSLLLKYFKSCSLDPSSSIAQRVTKEKEEYVRHFKRIMGSPSGSVARSRFQIGVRLYYRVMASMLKREEERLSTKDFSSLLHSDLFHKSLLACALEVVNVTYEYSPSEFSAMPGSASRLLFPWLLDVFSLTAYDFSKVLESFMKDEPRLTQEAKKHLQSIETRIVESMAWQSSSPLHDVIQTAGTTLQLTSPITASSRTNGLSSTNTTAADMYLSPLRPNPRLLATPREATPTPSALTSPAPHHPSQVGSNLSPQPSNIPMSPRKMRSVSLNMFLNKVLQLAYGRLERLCNMLNVSKDLEKYMWTCVEYCVTNKADLLKNRHLDQILMSCIYSICKVTDSELKFKDIVNAYRTLPHAEATTYRNVDIDGTNEDSIIIFYNRVFMPSMKIYILQFQLKNPTPTLSPAPTRSSTLAHASPGYRAAPNLYISPMKESPFKSPHPVREVAFRSPSQNTPRKRTRYSFGDGPGSAEKLREINERMREASVDSTNNTRSSTSKRLKFEDEDVQASTTSQTNSNGSNGNNVSSTNSHSISKPLSDDPMGTRPLPPNMQHRVAMMTSDRNASLGVVESKK